MNLGVSQLLILFKMPFFLSQSPSPGQDLDGKTAGLVVKTDSLFFVGKIEGEQRVDLGSWVNPRASLSDVHAGFPIPAPQLLQIKVKK